MHTYDKKIFLQNFNISVFKNFNFNYIYIYNNNFYCLIKTAPNVKIINKNTINFIFNTKEEVLKKNVLTLFLKQFNLYEYTKIKFTGKGYKIKKNTKNSLVLLFNRSHTTTLWWTNVYVKKLKKYKIYVKYTQNNYNIIKTILSTRTLNIFTKKGLRKSRQIVFKKKSKK